MAAFLSRLRWQALQAADGAGWPGGLALLAAVAALGQWMFWSTPLLEQESRLRSELATLEQRRTAKAPQADAGAGAAAELSSFRHRFPQEREIGPVFARVHALALRHGLALPQAEFRLNAGADDDLARYTMSLPLKADYRRLRAFITDLLREVPSVALQELVLRRDDAKTAQLEARLRLVMFVSPAE